MPSDLVTECCYPSGHYFSLSEVVSCHLTSDGLCALISLELSQCACGDVSGAIAVSRLRTMLIMSPLVSGNNMILTGLIVSERLDNYKSNVD